MPKLDRDGDVFLLSLATDAETNVENRFTLNWLESVNALLDEVEASEGPAGLVTLGAGKFYSNGLDQEWLFANLDKFPWYLSQVQKLFARVLTLGMPTAGALQGHTFGAGAMLALSHDHQIMRTDRGFFCLPEVNIGLPFTDGMNDLVLARVTKRTAHEAMTTGRRWGAVEAAAAGLVSEHAGEDEVLSKAIARTAGLTATRGPILGRIKSTLYRDTTASLLADLTGLKVF